jgi:Predicted pPIWI-associating nuclease
VATQRPHAADDSTEWPSLIADLDGLRKEITAHQAVTVGRQASRQHAKSVVQQYFRSTRGHLLGLGFTDGELVPLDGLFQELLQLANGVNAKAAYAKVLRDTKKLLSQVEVNREMRLGSATSQSFVAAHDAPTHVEQAILATLRDLARGAALGYEQALRDIQDEDRLSYRGVASELRETVREVLDRLAPDKDLQQAGVKIEKDQKGYTQKQKVRHILRSRGVGETARKVPEQSIQLIEELTASLTRSVYERGSLSAHVASPRSEVQQLKLYVDGVLAELLEVHRDRNESSDDVGAI